MLIFWLQNNHILLFKKISSLKHIFFFLTFMYLAINFDGTCDITDSFKNQNIPIVAEAPKGNYTISTAHAYPRLFLPLKFFLKSSGFRKFFLCLEKIFLCAYVHW